MPNSVQFSDDNTAEAGSIAPSNTELSEADGACPNITSHQTAATELAGARRALHQVFRALTRQPRYISSTEARQHFSDLVAWTAETDRLLIVTNHGRPQAVILSFPTFEKVAKGIARAVLALGARRSDLSVQAKDTLEAEGAAVAKRLRRHGTGTPRASASHPRRI